MGACPKTPVIGILVVGGLYIYAPLLPTKLWRTSGTAVTVFTETGGDKAYKLARPTAVEP
jgi:hypothetical protein